MTDAAIALVLSGVGVVIALVAAGFSFRSDRRSAHAEERADRHDQRRLLVTCRLGYTGSNEALVEMIDVEAVNQGHRPVELRSLFFVLDTGETIWPMKMLTGHRLPRRLEGGATIVTQFDKGELDASAKGKRILSVALLDTEGARYTAPYPATAAGSGGT